MPTVIAVWYAALSLVAFVAYGWDKRRANRGERRVPERVLRAIDFLGGFPGGFAAQRLFRHKTRKLGFQLAYWLIVASHAAGWIGWAWLSRARN